MRDCVEVSFRVSRILERRAAKLVEKGVFRDKSELFRQALRDLLQKFEVMATENTGSS